MQASRRKFLQSGPALALLPFPALATRTTGGRVAVLVYLKGGNDGYNTFVPLDNARYRELRPTLAIRREQTLHFSDTHGFNAALKPLLPAWQSRELLLVQGIGQEEVTNQHYRDLEMQYTGASPAEYLAEGWITRALGAARQDSGLGGIAFGDLDIRVSDPMGPFRGERIPALNVVHPSEWLTRRQLTGTQHALNAPARQLPAPIQVPAALALKTAFPADEFGDALRATVELIAAGQCPPAVHITLNAANGDHHDAFDTHWDQNKHHSRALTRLAEGLAAFRSALIETGTWDRVLLATYDEFGRSPRENDRQGTHHGWSTTHLVLGGRVAGGLIGEAPPVPSVFSISGAKPVIDTRALYTTIIERWWGLNAGGIFDRRFKPLDLLRA